MKMSFFVRNFLISIGTVVSLLVFEAVAIKYRWHTLDQIAMSANILFVLFHAVIVLWMSTRDLSEKDYSRKEALLTAMFLILVTPTFCVTVFVRTLFEKL